MNKDRQHGLSTLELLVGIVATASVAFLALPRLEPLYRSDSLGGLRAEFTQTLAFARNEAIKRKVPVLVTATAPQPGNEYGRGWKTWADLNGNGVLELNELIETHGALPSSARLRAAGNRPAVVFDAQGRLAQAAPQWFSLCPAGSRARSYLITALPDGQLEVNNNALCPNAGSASTSAP